MSNKEQMRFLLGIDKMDADDLCVALMLLKPRLAKLGLFRTVKAIDKAAQAIGWELAERFQESEKVKAQ